MERKASKKKKQRSAPTRTRQNENNDPSSPRTTMRRSEAGGAVVYSSDTNDASSSSVRDEMHLVASETTLASTKIKRNMKYASSGSNRTNLPPAKESVELETLDPFVSMTSLWRENRVRKDVQPGSYSISPSFGIDRHFAENDDTQEVEVSTVPITAELVDEAAQEEMMENERKRIRDETVRQIQASAPQAEIFDDSADRKKRRRLILLLVVVTILSAVGSIILGVVLSRKKDDELSREELLESILESIYGETLGLEDMESAHSEAFNWMSRNDTTFEDLIETENEELLGQRFVMCVLAFSTDIHSWSNMDNWLNGNISECQWHGITCDDHSRIVGINLALNQMNGTVPSDLGLLDSLTTLFLHGNPSLGGTIPTELGGMLSLVMLYANDNRLSGTLPVELGSLSRLQTLNLARNEITGPIPMKNAFSSLYELVDLDLSGNKLQGPIPDSIWHWQRLRHLELSSNMLSSTIPSGLGFLVELRRVEVQENRLTGSIPTHLGALINLESLNATGNGLSGSVPDSLCRLDELEFLETDCTLTCSCCSTPCS